MLANFILGLAMGKLSKVLSVWKRCLYTTLPTVVLLVLLPVIPSII